MGEVDRHVGEAVERYLWDPAAPPVDEVVALERALAPLRHREEPAVFAAAELAARRPRWRLAVSLAAAAALVLLGGAAVAAWLWSWPVGKAWPVVEGEGRALAVGQPVRIGAGESLSVRVARVGWMRVEGDALLRLLSTTSNRHRLSLDEGTLRAGLWAPPGTLGIITPAGEVYDLGCEFLLRVGEGRTRVDVASGWVQLTNAWGESIVPAGAWSSMVATHSPSAPVYRDAEPRFQAAVEGVESAADPAALETVLAAARPRDALTLLVLANREPEARGPLLRRAAELAPPPSGDLLELALGGDRRAVWSWIRQLPLPPPKRWLPNWRDGWPDVSAERRSGIDLRRMEHPGNEGGETVGSRR